MTSVDRLNGVNSGLAYKAPVKAATTANITLSGEQTIAGVSCTDGDYVLVKDQSTASQNGIYVVSTGTWTRRADFDGNRDIVKGTRVRVTDGSNAGVYEVSSSNPITIDSSSISFVAVDEGLDVSAFMLTVLDAASASAARTTLDVGQKVATDPREYGVAFDGLTASASANVTAWNSLIAAINAGTVDTVVMPAGTCYINAALNTITWAQGDFTIRGQGHGATQIRMVSTAGTAGTFFTFGDADDNVRDFVLADFGLENENEATLNGTGNALVFANTLNAVVTNLAVKQANGFLQLGSTSLGTDAQKTRVLLCSCSAYAPAGGKTIDIQSSSNHNFTNCQFDATGAAHANFRGMYIHPGASDTMDAGRFTACVWNYGGPNPTYNIEMDATDNDIATQQFVNCIIDQAVGGANVYIHKDSGGTANLGVDGILFTGCGSNGSTGTNTLLLDNTGGENFDVSWVGGYISTNGSAGSAVNVIGGNRVNVTLSGVRLMNRSTSTAGAAIVLADGVDGVTVNACSVDTRDQVTTGTPFVPFTHLVEFEGDSENCIITNNDASICGTGLILSTSSLASRNVIQNNLHPDNSIAATADGLTTGLIPPYIDFVTLTSDDANKIVTLPSAAIGMRIRGYIGATGCEMRTPSASGETINNVDCDGTNEAAIPATTYWEAECVAADTWILKAWTEGGAALTITPDAA